MPRRERSFPAAHSVRSYGLAAPYGFDGLERFAESCGAGGKDDRAAAGSDVFEELKVVDIAGGHLVKWNVHRVDHRQALIVEGGVATKPTSSSCAAAASCWKSLADSSSLRSRSA